MLIQRTEPAEGETPPNEGRWLMAQRRRGGSALMVAIALPLLSGVLLVGQAFCLASLLHRVVVEGADLPAVTTMLLTIAVLMITRIGLGIAAERAGIGAAERIKRSLRGMLYGALLDHRPDWTSARSSGALSAVIVDQTEALDGFFARYLPAMVQATILPLAFAAAILPVDVVVGLLFLVTAPLIPLFMALVGWGAEAATRAQADAFTRLSGLFADRLRGIVTLKLFDRADSETQTVVLASESLRKRTLGVLKIAFLSSAVLEFFAALGVAGVALYVGLTYLGFVDLRGSPLTLQAGLFCLLMAPEVYQPLRQLAAHYHDRAAAKAAVAEMAQQFGALPDLAESTIEGALPEPAPASSALAVSVALEGLTVYTPDRKHLVLDDVTLAIQPGTHIALLGQSGIGKSTLLEAMARLRAFDGKILIGGELLEDLAEADLRSRVAFLGQRPRLFHGTIADNIRLGRSGASDPDIRIAAERATVMEFACTLPEGLDTPIGEGGVGLSGGEAHRVALARIFLRDPGLILLDEPTAHLDTATEERVIDALLAFAVGRTLVVATHSAAIAARLDRTYRIAGGRVLPAAHPRWAGPQRNREGVA
ncbi:thiol reductant ABC exporter subunit CydD [Microvirga antarctica]|uniref:thiol reductant ABC exporter subunit CydD n=1 Tax=Microvirga antarctica TaxID=2819233 RepID=UPI001B306659|nr:thiol reductant ABC exporter subunit CydD [Microvirga antarctica]